MGIPITFAEHFAALLQETATWEARTGFDANGNKAYATGVSISCRRQAMNLREGQRIRYREARPPLIDPSDSAYIDGSIGVNTLDRLTFSADPTIPFIVTDVYRYYNADGSIY